MNAERTQSFCKDKAVTTNYIQERQNSIKMKIYFAPLEGVTGHIYRNAYEEFYGKGRIDKYFVPFISPNQTNGFTAREQRDMNPDNNVNMPLAVQIMTNRADLFINAHGFYMKKAIPN